MWVWLLFLFALSSTLDNHLPKVNLLRYTLICNQTPGRRPNSAKPHTTETPPPKRRAQTTGTPGRHPKQQGNITGTPPGHRQNPTKKHRRRKTGTPKQRYHQRLTQFHSKLNRLRATQHPAFPRLSLPPTGKRRHETATGRLLPKERGGLRKRGWPGAHGRLRTERVSQPEDLRLGGECEV